MPNEEPKKSLVARYWAAVIKSDGCWGWRRAKHPHGYGVVGNGNRLVYAHRLSWTLHRGPIPKGMKVLHKCDNPPCSSPDHLFLGTQGDNMADMARKFRSGTSKLSANQVRRIRLATAIGMSQQAAADIFGVTQAAIWYVVHRFTYKHVEA